MDDLYYLERLKVDGRSGTSNQFISIFTSLQLLNNLVAESPERIGPKLVTALTRVLDDRSFANQRKAYFYYLQAAEILVQRTLAAPHALIADTALQALQTILYRSRGPAQQAVADSLCRLPLNVHGPTLEAVTLLEKPRLDCHELAVHQDLAVCGQPKWFGRSLVYRLSPPHEKHLLVFKLARKSDSITALSKEARWLMYFQASVHRKQRWFDVPKPIGINGNHVFRLKHVEDNADCLHPQTLAIGFVAPETYFSYPNNPACTPAEQFKAILGRNSRLLGRLAGMGIVHTDPIPLFHNRAQAGRRDDNGRYQWFRAGRLDRWLASCDYPNLGPSGLRDFEHLIAFNGTNRELYGHVGNQLLGLLLLAGSYFRNRDRSASGYDSKGEPGDVRCLFEPRLFEQIVNAICKNYYEGFTGRKLRWGWPFNLKMLVQRLIDEMGRDRHMLETLRVADQKNMSEADFTKYLHNRGLSTKTLKPGVRDIEICSGPHLGAFNRGISVPELIDAVRSVTALCLLDRYRSCSLHLQCGQAASDQSLP